MHNISLLSSESLQSKAASNYPSPSSVRRIDCLTLLVQKSHLTPVLLQAMSNETAGANSGWHTSLTTAKDVPFVRNKLIFPFSKSSLLHYISYLLQGSAESMLGMKDLLWCAGGQPGYRHALCPRCLLAYVLQRVCKRFRASWQF